MYCSKAELAQRPNDLMIELCTPADATVVAAPIRNEWPLNCDGSMPALVRVEWRRSSVTNSGPGLVPQNSRYDKRALDLPVSALEICRTG